MLRKLTLENFFSVRDAQALDLRIAKNATDPDGRFAKPVVGSEGRFPKVVVLFGANASGKTNILRALAFLQNFAAHSADSPRDSLIPFLHFDADECLDAPTHLSVEFDAELFPDTGRQVFQYELELAPDFMRVNREALYFSPRGRKRRLFVRTNNEIDAGSDFNLKKNDPIRQKIRSNASAISMLAKFNHPFSVAVYEGVKSVGSNVTISGKHPISSEWATNYYRQVDECFRDFNKDVQKFDFGIESVQMETKGNGIEARFTHSGLDNSVSLVFESQGTVNLFRLYPLIWYALRSGSVVVLDELDNDIHPLFLPEIVRLFQDPDSNPFDAQLVMSCHNATMLESLCKEEVYFTEKDPLGRTRVYGLKEIRHVRRDANLYAKYLSGAFGATPRVA